MLNENDFRIIKHRVEKLSRFLFSTAIFVISIAVISLFFYGLYFGGLRWLTSKKSTRFFLFNRVFYCTNDYLNNC